MIPHRLHRRPGTFLLIAVITVSLLLLAGCQGLAAGANGPGTVGVATGHMDFGPVAIGDSATLPNTISNNTSSAVTISSIQGLGADFQVTGIQLPIVLGVGQSVSFFVQFQPTGAGDPTTTIAFAGNNALPYVSMFVRGRGVLRGGLSANPSPVVFANMQVGSHKTTTVTLSNNGGAELTITQATLSGAGFSMSNLNIPLRLSPGQTTPFTITFAPTRSGRFFGGISFTTTSVTHVGRLNTVVLGIFGFASSPAALTLNPPSLAFGNIQVGTHTGQAESLTNTGGSRVTVSQAMASGSGFAVQGLALPITLNPGQSAPFTVIFSPTESGAVSGDVNITSDEANPNLSLPLSGTGVAAGALNANPTKANFGKVMVGSSHTMPVTVANSGGEAVTLSSAAASGGGFKFPSQNLPVTLNAGQSTTLSVVFAPSATGAASGTLAINSDASSGTLSVPLSGMAVSQGQLGSSPSSFSFGNTQIGTSKSLSGTLTNSGGASLTISAATASPGFGLSGLTLPVTLDAGQSTSFTVLFAPTTGAAASGSLSITSTSSDTSLSIPLSGTGVTQGLVIANPTSLSFGNVQVGNNSSLSETLTNSGGTSLTISAAAASSGFGLSGLALPVTLNAGQSTSFTVIFTPTTSGAASGNLSITSTGSNSSFTIPLSGTGVTQGLVLASPTSLAFGSVQVGNNSSLSETLTNSGGTSLTISAATASSGFGLSGLALPVTLNAGQSTSFTVIFTPTASGAASGNLSITSTGSNSSFTIPLSGTGVTQGTLTANPTSLAFGSVQIGNNSSLSETLTNTGGTSLTISAATASSGFGLSGLALPVTLNAGQSTSFTVIFTPTTSGAASGNLSITSTGSNSSLSIPLSGTGVTPGTLIANPTSLAFGSVQVGNNSSLSETLTNSGGSSLTISAATASTGFSLSGLALPVTLNAGQSTSFTVIFTPTTSGAASGNVNLTSNGTNPNLSIPLSGTAQSAGTLTANPTSLSFGSVQVGGSANLSETLTNNGGTSITISQANLTGAGFSISGLTVPMTLTANQSVTFTATFAPTTAGAANRTLSVVSNASNSPLSIVLSGTGTAAGTLAVTPTSLSFGNVTVGLSAALNGSLNASGAPVTVTSASLSNGEFVISGILLPVTIPAGQSAPFTVTFTPQGSGATSASLSLSSNATNSPAVQTMTGTGKAAVQHSVDLTWTAASNAAGYNIYRGDTTGGPYVMINASLDGTTAYTDNTVVSGQTYYYVITTVDSDSNESGYSNQIQAVIPNP